MTDGPQPDPLLLAELIAARLCHDLSGPIGPMAGVVELAGEDPGATEEALAVAAETAGGLIARIRLLRAAWGGDCPAMDIEAIGALVSGGAGRKRVAIDLSGVAKAPVASATARLLLNALMLGIDSLPAGGTVASAGDPAGDMLITIRGPRAAWPPGLATCLADPGAAARMLENPRAVQIPFIALLAHRPGPHLSLLFGADASSAPPLLISHRDRC